MIWLPCMEDQLEFDFAFFLRDESWLQSAHFSKQKRFSFFKVTGSYRAPPSVEARLYNFCFLSTGGVPRCGCSASAVHSQAHADRSRRDYPQPDTVRLPCLPYCLDVQTLSTITQFALHVCSFWQSLQL